MKTLFLMLLAVAALAYARAEVALPPLGEGVVVLPVGELPREVPLFYSVHAEVKATVGLDRVTGIQRLVFKVHQGKPEVMSVGLSGDGAVTSVTGAGLKDWSVRIAENGGKFLDLRPMVGATKLEQLEVEVTTQSTIVNQANSLMLPEPGTSMGFGLAVALTIEPGVNFRLLGSNGVRPVEGSEGKQFVASEWGELIMGVTAGGPGARGVDVLDANLTGKLSPDGNSVSFRLAAKVKAVAADSKVELMSGGGAISGGVSGDGWHLALRKEGDGWVHDLVAERAGEFPVVVDFEVPVIRDEGWSGLNFRLPGGVIVPVTIEGLGGMEFNRELAVMPVKDGALWKGFLPANGEAAIAWRKADVVADGTLFFSSAETSDVRVGSGLLRQTTLMDLRVLQGELAALSIGLDGPGEVLSVKGTQVLGWSVREDNGKRLLEVKLSQPIKGSGQITIDAQSALGEFPVKAQALRFIPAGALRHSGWLRVANEGAVRLGVVDSAGLIQQTPGQFPGKTDKELRQVFVYRFPSAEYAYAIQADQVLPEIAVTEVTVYELAETDRRMTSDLELDIREAPLREWEIEIPEDHAVASVTGAAVADYVLAGEVKNGKRRLKIQFKQPVIDRQLVSVKLEKNEAAKAGPWLLSPLGFPGVKSRRGYVGAVGAAGYRLVAGITTGVAEVPLTFFPKKVAGLQQAFRLKEEIWSVGLTVEALGQSVQADVFHLYSLKAGAVYGSVLVNYFVVGAPSSEWRISVPDGIGNIDVTGQNVGRDWRREGNVVIIPLSRPVSGAGMVLLTFEQPMSARGGEISPGEVRPLNVQGERGYVQVVSPLQVNYEVSRSDGALLALEASELPAEFRLLSSAPTLKAWQYTSREFGIGMKIEWFDQGETAEQVVDYLKLASKVSKDGQWVTDARFFVKSKDRNGVRLRMPAGAVLWEARVAGESVNARETGGEMLLPLPAGSDPNEAVEVSLRYGARAAKERSPRLIAPVLAAPVVIGEWLVRGDEGRRLVPDGGSAQLVKSVLAENGWEWIGRHPTGVLTMIALAIGALLLVRRVRWLAVLLGLAVAVVALGLGFDSLASWGNSAVLEYAAPVVAGGAEVAVELKNVPAWQAAFGLGVWVELAFGVGLLIAGSIRRQRLLSGLGIAMLAAGVLSIRGGAPWFFGCVILVGLAWALPRGWSLLRDLRARRMAGAVAALMVGVVVFGNGEANAAGIKVAESMVQDWRIQDGRLSGKMDVTVRGDAGDRFLLLKSPAVLGAFSGEGMKVVKAPAEDADAYFIEVATGGRWSGKVEFEMPLMSPADGWDLPSGRAVMRQVTVRWDQAGWEFISPHAAKISPIDGLAANESGAVMVLDATEDLTITARPKQRDVAAEETKFFVEVMNLFVPSPGLVSGRHKVAVRPSQGRISSLVMRVPDGFTVSDVVDGPVASWRFDPEKRELRVGLEPAQEQAFSLRVESQRGAGALPVDLVLEPLRVIGAAGEVGALAIGLGDEVQQESVEVSGLSRVDAMDFVVEMKSPVPVQQAFRYGTAEAQARVKVAAVSPEIRSEFSQLISLGEDRLVVATDLTVDITRAGIFSLDVAIPAGFEIESASGEGLSHWTESGVGNERLLTLHLTGKTIGKQMFNLTLSGAAVTTIAAWEVPRISLRGASRETGVVTIVPDRGLQVRAVTRRNISQVDPRELTGGSTDAVKAAARPGAIAYRVLQGDWALALGISKLEPWVTAQVFHDATLREGQLLARIGIAYRIENSAVKSLRVRLPGLDAEAAATVRATGPAVADLLPVAGEDGLWEIRFQRGIAGETKVELEYQRKSADAANELITPVLLEEVRQAVYFVAIRAGGRLELATGALPRGWQRTDWSVVQSALGGLAGSAAPVQSFRVADAEGPLAVSLKRHDLADLRKLRVAEGNLLSLISPQGAALTAVDLKMQVTAKSTLRLRLPKGAELFSVRVNDEGANLVREGDEWLFYVFPSPEPGKPASVRLVYSAKSVGKIRLEGPRLDVPMENLSWRVLVPEGWTLVGHGGDFELNHEMQSGDFRLEDYQSFVSGKRANDSLGAAALLDQANVWLRQGDQERAGVALGSAVRSNLLDEASNEDARVQLRQLKTQQAVLGLNTRRQKLVLDNRGEAGKSDKDQLQQAAEANPVLRGDFNFNPKEFDRFMAGNTADENTALKEIANRIVSQQLAAEPAPVALEVTMLERGKVLTFGRSVQVDGDRPMAIELKLKQAGGSAGWLGILACGVIGWMGVKRKSHSPYGQR